MLIEDQIVPIFICSRGSDCQLKSTALILNALVFILVDDQGQKQIIRIDFSFPFDDLARHLNPVVCIGDSLDANLVNDQKTASDNQKKQTECRA